MILKINDKDYTLEWGMGAIEIYCDMCDCDIDDIDTHLAGPKLIDQMRAINMLTLAAIKNGCENATPKMQCEIDYRNLQKWLDHQPQETGADIIEDWKKSYYFGKTVAEYFFGQVSAEIKESKKTSVKKKIALEK